MNASVFLNNSSIFCGFDKQNPTNKSKGHSEIRP
jgi:hypothetical protein